MLAFIALFFPAAIMVVWKRKLCNEEYNWQNMLIEYMGGLVLLNFFVISISYFFFGNSGNVVEYINTCSPHALKYIFLSMVLALLIPLFLIKVNEYLADIKSEKSLKENKYNNIFKRFFNQNGKLSVIWLKNVIITVVLSAIVGTLLLFAVMQIPQSALYENAKEASALLYSEDTYPSIFSGTVGSRLDNFTDGLMISTAYTSTGDWIDDALLPSRVIYQDNNPMQSIYKYFFDYEDTYSIATYGRYWHGYLVYLRPLLSVMSYSSIRAMNMVVQLALMITLIYLLAIKNLKHLIIPVVASWICMCPPAIWKSLQYSSIFYITLIACIYVVLKHTKLNNMGFCRVMLLCGIMTAFLDLLTAPLLTYGIPVILYFSIKFREKESVKTRVKQLIAYSVSWIAGYGGMWVSKWIIATMLTDQNIIMNAFSNVAVRTSHSSEWAEYSWFGVIKSNFDMLKSPMVIMACILVIIAFLIFIIKFKCDFINSGNLLIMLIVCLSPFVWYFVLMNHSGVHYWMTFRELGITIFGILSLLFSHINFDHKRVILHRKQINNDELIGGTVNE